MALLNFATTYDEVKGNLSLVESSKDYIKLFFTKDGHIITHGVDYIPWGANGIIPINRLPINNNEASDKYLWDSLTIQNKINQSFAANDAMRFRGTIGLISIGNYTINGNRAEFPSKTAQVGDTYRVVTAGIYATIQCEVGDLLICIKADPTGETTAWTVAQTNINGQIQHTINGIPRNFYSNDSQAFDIYAPTASGAAGQVLISNGPKTSPIWTNQSNIIAGELIDTAKKALFTGLSYANDVLTITIGGTTKTASIHGRRAVNVNGTEVLPISDSAALKFVNGTGISLTWDSKNKNLSVNANTNYSTNNSASKNYAVKTDTNQQLYVHVPWTDTTYGVVSKNANGLTPQVINTNTNLINQNFYLLASTDGQATPSWYKLPTNSFVNTWRTVQVNGTSIGDNILNLINGENVTLNNNNGQVTINASWRTIKVGGVSIEDKSLNFMPTGDIYVKTADQNNTTEDEFDIGFGIAWYNVSKGTYEYE